MWMIQYNKYAKLENWAVNEHKTPGLSWTLREWVKNKETGILLCRYTPYSDINYLDSFLDDQNVLQIQRCHHCRWQNTDSLHAQKNMRQGRIGQLSWSSIRPKCKRLGAILMQVPVPSVAKPKLFFSWQLIFHTALMCTHTHQHLLMLCTLKIPNMDKHSLELESTQKYCTL